MLFLNFCFFLFCVNGVTERNGVLVADYKEVEIMKKFPDNMNYEDIPMIITNSAMKDWTLYKNLISGNIYIENAEYHILTQQANCSYFNNEDICKKFVSSFIYRTDNLFGYEYWNSYEEDVNSNITDKYKSFVIANHQFDEYLSIKHLLPKDNKYFGLNSSPDIISSILSKEKLKNINYTKFYTYYNVFGYGARFANYIDHISLSPFFQLFNLTRGYKDIASMHIFFANSYYRTIRHFDKTNNLFFMLNGSRIFKLSKPTCSIFNIYPYYHTSGRQQYPNYPFLSDDERFDNEEYQIFNVELYENEVLYIPTHWFHEVINSNFSVAMNIWWDTKDNFIEGSLIDNHDKHLPIDINNISVKLTSYQIDELMYFIQRLIDEFCGIISKHKDVYKYPMKCLNNNYNGYGYLLQNFVKIYPILNSINYNNVHNMDWIFMSLKIKISDIFKCAQGKKTNYTNWRDIDLLISNFIHDTYYCHYIGHDYETLWNIAIEQILNNYFAKMSNIAIAEMNFVHYLEHVLFTLTQETNILPLWIALQLL